MARRRGLLVGLRPETSTPRMDPAIRADRWPGRTGAGRTRWPRRTPGRTRWRRRTRRTRRTGWPPGRTRRTRWPWSPRRAWWALAWGSAAWLLPRGPVGRRTRTLGTGRTTAAGLGQAAPAARGALGRWPNQLLGLPGKPRVGSRVQPVGLLVLRGLDPPVRRGPVFTRRPLRRLARRASCVREHPSYAAQCTDTL